MKKRIISMLLVIVICLATSLTLTSCTSGSGDEAFVIMTETLDGLFNPFFSTSANDGTIVAMTQIGMLGSKLDENRQVVVAYGENEATATLDFEQSELNENNETVYTFVIKNGIKYSDGHPLTIEDVLFNLYVYLDPVYTGSATIYSTDIKGLAAYRNQQIGADNDSSSEGDIDIQAQAAANERIMTLVQLFYDTNKKLNPGSSTNSVPYAEMVSAIKSFNIQKASGYLNAVAVPSKQSEITYQHLLDDYELALKYFREELESDYNNAPDSYTEEPYKSHAEFQDPVFCFMFKEGLITPKYAKFEGTNRDDKSKIIGFEYGYDNERIKDKDSAIQKVYNDTVTNNLDQIVLLWATATKLKTEFAAKAKEVILRSNMNGDDLLVPRIEGIVSIGHNTDRKTVTVNGNTYNVAHEHNEDGTPKNPGEYDVLEITINGVDPKAVWNFAFSVAPQHYYGMGSSVGMDIANNKFGVEFSSFDYMRDVLQTPNNNKLPMGAGPYKVTDRANSDNPSRNDFFSNNIVYFKANEYFETVGSGLNNPKIEKVRYQVVSASNALAALEEGSVHYITPQYSKDNYTKIAELTKGNYESLTTHQLGYGYIGINASKVTDINIRKAIMCAMNTTLALDYYAGGTASQIYWPMSKVSWAYPQGDADQITNGRDYPQSGGQFDENIAIDSIKTYMQKAGAAEGDSRLKITFTIAGSNLQDHPTYKCFRDAATLLNSLGWDVTVEPDTQALTKLATGSLTVWAAAWGSTIDPDLYQVYHKNSTATSTLAWGYPYLTKNGTAEEKNILNKLSLTIDKAREINERDERSALYKEAMGYILDLAIELPVYQRSSVYVYNTDIINPDTIPNDINPYSSPLDRIWELEFAEGAFSGKSGLSGGTLAIVFGIVLAAAAVFCASLIIRSKMKNRSPILAYALPESALGKGVSFRSSIPVSTENKKNQYVMNDSCETPTDSNDRKEDE